MQLKDTSRISRVSCYEVKMIASNCQTQLQIEKSHACMHFENSQPIIIEPGEGGGERKEGIQLATTN